MNLMIIHPAVRSNIIAIEQCISAQCFNVLNMIISSKADDMKFF